MPLVSVVSVCLSVVCVCLLCVYLSVNIVDIFQVDSPLYVSILSVFVCSLGQWKETRLTFLCDCLLFVFLCCVCLLSVSGCLLIMLIYIHQVDSPLYVSVLSVFVYSLEQWKETRVTFLKRLLVLAHARHTCTAGSTR